MSNFVLKLKFSSVLQPKFLFSLTLENHEKTKAVQLLLESIDGEIDTIKECIECYFNACKYPTHWFTMVCTKPHLIIWAKVRGFSYWPAKIKSINGEEINVHFFGDYTCAVVPAKNCCLYSKSSPKSPSKTSSMYKAALKVYILIILFQPFRFDNAFV